MDTHQASLALLNLFIQSQGDRQLLGIIDRPMPSINTQYTPQNLLLYSRRPAWPTQGKAINATFHDGPATLAFPSQHAFLVLTGFTQAYPTRMHDSYQLAAGDAVLVNTSPTQWYKYR